MGDHDGQMEPKRILTTLRPDGGIFVDLGESPQRTHFIDLGVLSPESPSPVKIQPAKVVEPSPPARGAILVDLGEFTPGNEPLASSSAADGALRAHAEPRTSFTGTFAGFAGLAEGKLSEVREQLRSEAAARRRRRGEGSPATGTSTAGPSAPALSTDTSSLLGPSISSRPLAEPARRANAAITERRAAARQLQPGSACSEPFPEPCSVTASAFLGSALSSVTGSVFPEETETVSPKVSPTALQSVAVTQGGLDASGAAVASSICQAFSAARSELTSFKRRGSQELVALEKDMRQLLERQEEAEQLAADVAALVLAESRRHGPGIAAV